MSINSPVSSSPLTTTEREDGTIRDSTPSLPGKALPTTDVVLLPRDRISRTNARWRNFFVASGLTILLTPFTFLWHREMPVNPADYAERTRRVLNTTPLIDGHNDLPWQLRVELHNRIYDNNFDPTSHLLGHTDLQRIRKGQMGGQFWSVYVDCDENQQHFEDPSVRFSYP